MFAKLFRHHALLFFFIGFYLCLGYTISTYIDEESWFLLSTYSSPNAHVSLLYFLVFFLYHALTHAFRRPTGSLWGTIYKDFKEKYVSSERLLNGTLIIAILPLFMSTYTSLKSMIPLLSSFSWDNTLSAFDKSLHFGFYPHELLQPLLGYPFITTFINFFYHLWFFLLYSFMFWQAFSLKNPYNREQFFLSLVLCWAILGTFTALIFSSAGPCYFTQVTGLPTPYDSLFSYLTMANEQYPVWALSVQQELWNLYKDEAIKLGSGIAAMPSMHISVSMLFVLTTRTLNNTLYKASLVFLVLIMLGSVHLGWHYAIDGYVAILGTMGIWKLSGILIQAWHGLLSKANPAQEASSRVGAQ